MPCAGYRYANFFLPAESCEAFQVDYQTCQGQCLDMLGESKAIYSEECYNSIVKLKVRLLLLIDIEDDKDRR